MPIITQKTEEFNDQPVNAVGDDMIIIEDGSTSDSQTNPSELVKNNKCGNNGQSIHEKRVGDKSDTGSDPIGVGPNNMGLPASCFGPFPSRFTSITMVGSPCLEDMFNVVNDGRLKRRRLLEDDTNLFFPNPFEHNTQTTPRTTVPSRNTPSPPPPIAEPSVSQLGVEQNGEHSAGFEFRATIEVGKQIGIVIEEKDPILAEIIGEIGETNIDQ
ncbi:hypothetical protein L2E82_34721 [Cichorium intybus]|uniref:Uncharacterized protein n=1 Tax=Cichorium intybus TaxID=13427 RepID=A0ACB9BML5_CICIN|nr:hypothetical protein L2E82_34721 [Cichorium intybus]